MMVEMLQLWLFARLVESSLLVAGSLAAANQLPVSLAIACIVLVARDVWQSQQVNPRESP